MTSWLLTFLTSCSPPGVPLENPGHDRFTGGTTDDGRKHTAGSDDDTLETLKTSIDGDNDANRDFAKQIESVDMGLLNSNGRPVSTAPDQVRVIARIRAGTFSRWTIEFIGAPGTELRPLSDRPVRLQVDCTDRDCRTAILRFSLLSDDGVSVKAKAGLIRRERDATVRARPVAGYDPSARSPKELTMLLDRYVSGRTRRLITSEIAWGASAFFADLSDVGLCLRGRLVETSTEDDLVVTSCQQSSSLGSGDTPAAKLIGNNNRGSFLIKVGSSPQAAIVSILTQDLTLNAPADSTSPDNGTTLPVTPAPGDAPGTDAAGARTGTETGTTGTTGTGIGTGTEGFVDVDAGSTERFIPLDPTNPITRAWQKDRNRPEIKSSIESWKRSKEMGRFLLRAQPNLQVMLDALKTRNIPAEIVFITLIESKFFINEGFPVEVSSASAGAVGPWQFMPETAKGKPMSLKIRPLRKSGSKRTADPCDERADLAKSSLAAAKYFRILFDMFPKDSKLALLSYNWGHGNVDDAMDCLNSVTCLNKMLQKRKQAERLQEIRGAGLNFWSVKEFKMAPAEGINYVIRFLGAQFVGRDPKAFGLELPDAKTNPSPKYVPTTCGS